jgi:hypothetical protein
VPEVKNEPKKPRAFVEETDIFDFSNLQKTTEQIDTNKQQPLKINKMGSGTKSIGGSNSGSSAKRPFEMPNQD